MLTGAARIRLANDASIGAGTFFQHVLDTRPRTEQVLWADPDFRGPEGRVESVFTLDRLDTLVETYAGWFHSRGVCPRDPVAVRTGSATEIVVSFLALTGLGAVPALVNGNLPAGIAAAYVSRLGVAGLVTDAAHAPAPRGPAAAADPRPDAPVAPMPASTGPPFHGTFGDIRPEHRDALPAAYPYRHAPEDPVLITHSSGTTGVPKAVCASHAGFFAATRYRLGLPLPQGYERALSALPPSHNSGITIVMLSLLCGMPVRILSRQHGAAVLDAIEEFRPTMVTAFSGTYAELATGDLAARDLSSVAIWYNSGDAAHRAHIREMVRHGRHVEVSGGQRREVPGSLFHDGLGSSEMGHSLFSNIHRPGDDKPMRCIGKPYGFVRAAVLSADGTPLPPREIGRLGVKSPTLTPGYWNDSVTTYRSRLRGYWLTGDLVYTDEGGRFYHVDRVTDVIDTADGRLYSVWAEELLLDAFPELLDCTVFGVAGSDGRTRPYALVQPRAAARAPDAAPGSAPDPVPEAGPAADADASGWTRRVNGVLARAGMVGVAEAIVTGAGEVPVGPTGKVRKRELRDRYRALVGGGESR